MKIALVAAATQGVSRRKGAKQSPGDPPGEDVLRPVRGHALGCAWSPKAHLERLLGPFLPLTALIPLPASVPAHAEISEVGVASLRLLPARSPPRHGALHADKSSSSLGRPEKSALTLLPTPQRPQALKPITGAQHRGADAEVDWGCGRSFQVPRRAAGWKGCMHSHPAWAPAQGARRLRQGEVRVSHPNRGP